MPKILAAVVGVPGAGKTTILRKLKEIMPEIEVLNFGDFMMEEAVSYYGLLNRDEMRVKIGLDDYRKIQLRAAKKIADYNGDIVVLDTHAAIKTPNGYYPGLPTEVLKLLKLDAIIVLEFSPKDILSRRKKDGENSRAREIEEIEEIEEHQAINRLFAAAVANETTCYLKILRYYSPQEYPYQHAEQAANEIAKMLRALQSQKKLL